MGAQNFQIRILLQRKMDVGKEGMGMKIQD